MDFFDSFPAMERQDLRDLKKGIDSSFRDFSRAYGDEIEGFFEPLLHFLVWLEKLLVNAPWPVVIIGLAILAWLGLSDGQREQAAAYGAFAATL